MKFILTFIAIAALALKIDAYVVTNNQTVLTDGSFGDTQLGINYVIGLNQDNWTVVLGTNGNVFTWAGEVVFAPTNIINIVGQPGGTTIAGNNINFCMFFAGVSNKLITIGPNLTFMATNSGLYSGMLGVAGEGVNHRITGVTFLGAAANNFVIQDGDLEGTGSTDPVLGPYGIIDHCTFIMPGGADYNCVNVSCNGHANQPQTGWVSPMTYGTTNVVDIESCVFYQPGSGNAAAACVESDDAARWCFRYNQVTNMCCSWHGTNSGGKSSTLQTEVYGNVFTYTNLSSTAGFVLLSRGGTCLIWSNTIIAANSSQIGTFATFWVECAAMISNTEFCAMPLGYPQNYPAPQQIGQGSATNFGWQTNWPTYIWSNTTPSFAGGIGLGHDAGDAPFIVQGRDIFTNSAMPGYVPMPFPNPLIGQAGVVGTLFQNTIVRNIIIR